MKTIEKVFIGLIGLGLSVTAWSAADPDGNGKNKATTVCAACHGLDGNSNMPATPKLAGQYASYLKKELIAFRKGAQGQRNNPIMYGMAVSLSDQDIDDLAAYYAKQTMTPGGADEKLLALGEKIYRGGNIKTGVPACIACHSPNGDGNEAANYPRLSGQNADYVLAQLKAFRSGDRKNDPNSMMEGVAKAMTDDEMAAVSSYISGLH